LDIAAASLSELECALDVASDLGYVSEKTRASLETQQRHARFLVWKLHASLRVQ
jgi:hypothetical protein